MLAKDIEKRLNPQVQVVTRTSPKEVLALAQARRVEIVDLKFTDLPGTLQHYSVPISELDEGSFVSGFGFDGSSIRGFQHIHESDMLLIPDPDTAIIDPILSTPTLSMFCTVRDPITGESYARDPRYIAHKAEDFLRHSGLAELSYWGPEAEFFVFDDVRFDQNQYSGYYFIDSVEGAWNTGREEAPNLGYKPRYKEGYFPAPPTDTLQEFRSQVVLKMKEAGIEVEAHHHEVATAGQGEIDIRFNTLRRMADQLMMYKYIMKNVARACGKAVTFMPKPLFMDNGSGMHVHQSLWKDGSNLFYDEEGYAQISNTALHYIGGLLKHAPALLAFCAPTTNSYRRLVPGYEAPVNLVYSQRNRSACIRIPMYSPSPKSKRIEFRPPDPSCNPYLAFAAMLMAGIDGVLNRLDPGDPLDADLYELPPQEAARVKQVPGSLGEVLAALEEDHQFLVHGGVFTADVIETWIEYKRRHELDPVRLRPHPYEFYLYFDA
jgi:glutamine synthetase